MRRSWGYAFVVLASGLALSIGLVARRWDFGSAADDLDAAARDYRAAGLPWTAAELLPPLPESSNAAPLLLKAFDVWSPKGGSDDAALRIAHEALKRPALNFGVDWDQGLGIRFRFAQSASTSRLAELLAARATRRAAQGDDAGALADLDDARRLGALVGCEPSLRGFLEGHSCLRTALSGAIRCLNAAGNHPDRLMKYRAWLTMRWPEPDAGPAWRGEIYQAVAIARNLSREQMAGFLLPSLGPDPWRAKPTQPLLREGLPKEPLVRAFMARCLRMNAELARSTHGLNDPIEDVERTAKAIQKRAARSDGFSHNLDALLFPVYKLERTKKHLPAQRNVALAFAEGLIVHAKTGRWPAGTAVEDPCGRGPLKVRSAGREFRVWSLGPNGTDEGGLTSGERRARGDRRWSDDVVATTR